MRSRIFLYLFIFAVLYIIFQYANAKGVYENQESQIENLKLNVERYKSENDSLINVALESQKFTLSSNAYASEYFSERGVTPEEIEVLIEDAIIGRNKPDADNDLVPYEGMEGFMRINSIKVINNKWILANFTDGTYWGDLLLDYYISEEGELTLTTKDQVLYPKYD